MKMFEEWVKFQKKVKLIPKWGEYNVGDVFVFNSHLKPEWISYVEITQLEQNGTAHFSGVNGMNEEVNLTMHLNRFKSMPVQIFNNGKKMVISNIKRAAPDDLKRFEVLKKTSRFDL